MPHKTSRSSDIAWAMALWLGAMNLSSAQQRPAALSAEELQRLNDQKIAVLNSAPTPEACARAMLEQFEFVGSGKFVIDEQLPAQRDPLLPRTEIVRFQIDRVYKGAQSLPAIQVELNSDMLAVPNEHVSAYTKRDATWQNLSQQADRNKVALVNLSRKFEQGELNEDDYARQRRNIEDAERRRVARMVALPNRRLAVIDGKTFYELGGALQGGEKYLVGLNRARDRVDIYLLEEVIDNNIYWGEQRQDLVAVLDRLRHP
jgi:hypothetical protein